MRILSFLLSSLSLILFCFSLRQTPYPSRINIEHERLSTKLPASHRLASHLYANHTNTYNLIFLLASHPHVGGSA